VASGIFSDFAIFYFTLLRIFLLYYRALGDSRNFTAEFINLEFQASNFIRDRPAVKIIMTIFFYTI